MFVFEAPGTDDPNRVEKRKRTCGKFTKCPPIDGYYWLRGLEDRKWPTSVKCAAADGWGYGPQIAYFIWRFKLKDAYVTNAVKCNLVQECKENRAVAYGETKKKPVIDTRPIEKCCMYRFYREEVNLFKPDIVFAFGRRTEELIRRCQKLRTLEDSSNRNVPSEDRGATDQKYCLHYLRHPAWAHRSNHPLVNLIDENEKIIDSKIGCCARD
jgi:hypothetical protein